MPSSASGRRDAPACVTDEFKPITTTRSAPNVIAGDSGAFSRTPPSPYQPVTVGGR